MDFWDLFYYKKRLAEPEIMKLISNCIHVKRWDEITNPFPKINGGQQLLT